MTLAQDHVTISIGGATVRLRASLRAAIRLERQHQGFAPLLQAITEGSLSAVTSLITECGDHPAPESLLTAPGPEPIGARLERLQPQLALIVFQLADVSPPTDADNELGQDVPAPAPSSITLAKALEQTFGLATGVLGWSPDAAYAATASEIWSAMDMRLEMHRAANGIAAPEKPRTGPDNSTLDSAGLSEIALMGGF